MKQNIIKKLTSRKFILAMLTAIAGIVTMVMGDNAVVQVITGASMTVIPTVIYCIMEGKIDAESVKTITDATAEAAEKLGADDKTIDVIENLGNLGGVMVDDDLT